MQHVFCSVIGRPTLGGFHEVQILKHFRHGQRSELSAAGEAADCSVCRPRCQGGMGTQTEMKEGSDGTMRGGDGLQI